MRDIITYITRCIAAAILLCTGCVEEDSFDNSSTGNFDALWSIIDQRYCFFEQAKEQFGLDWDAVYDKYYPLAAEAKESAKLFDIMGQALKELRDGHVNLISEYGTTFYWDWKLNYPINFSDSLQRNYLGNDFKINNGIYYTTIEDSVAYAYVGSFANGFGNSNITAFMMDVAASKGLILDIRNNSGGMLTSAEQLASHFTKEKIHCGYIKHKIGKGHSDFSTPEPLFLEPGKGAIWLKPVVLLTNRGVYSAANHFVMVMRALPHVMVIGDKTGGGSGMPLNSTLPNGWGLRFSACPILDTDMQDTEFGISPDSTIHITSNDWNNGRDTMIESARQIIMEYYEKNNGKDDD